MAEIVGATAAAAQIPTSLISFVDLIRKVLSWREQLSEVQNDFKKLLNEVSELSHEVEHFHHTYSLSPYYKMGVREITQQIKIVTDELKIIESKMQTYQHGMFPSLTNEKIMKVQDEVRGLSDALRNLRSDAEYERLQAKSEGHDYFIAGKNNARMDGPDIILDFDSQQMNGKRHTCEGQLLDAVLALSNSKTVTACARGVGGAGKTCALRGVAHHPEVVKRFWGGILYNTLGQDAREGQLRATIVEMVKSSGGVKAALEISTKESLEDIIISAGEWFRPFPCLFLIDDVWPRNESEVRNFELVRNLARHPLSRVAFTTRDIALKGDVTILFEHRKKDGEDARAILLKTAGFAAKPRGQRAADSFEKLLEIGNGLPLKLALIGGGVRGVAELYSMSDSENAWTAFYEENSGKESKGERDLLMKTFSFLDTDSRDGDHHRHFKSLSVLRYGQSVSIDVVCRMWGLSKSESRNEAELLGRYQVVQLMKVLTNDTGGEAETVVSLHDEMLKIAREEAMKDDQFCRSARRVINSYLSEAQGASAKAVSSSGVSETSVSHPRFGLDARGMVCAVGKFAEDGGRDGERSLSECDNLVRIGSWPTVEGGGYFYENLCWLLSSGKFSHVLKCLISEPQWLIRQLRTLGVEQVQSDLDIISESVTDDAANELKRCIRLLKAAVNASKASLVWSKWVGMPWFQLYGRLLYFAEQSDWVRQYISKIEQLAPKPWYKPSIGCLVPASMSLQETVFVGGLPRCVALVGKTVSCCYQEKSGDIILHKHDLSRGADCDRTMLCKSTPELKDAALSGDARTVVLCLGSGDIVISYPDWERQPDELQKEASKATVTQSDVRKARKTTRKSGQSSESLKKRKVEKKGDNLEFEPKCYYEHVGMHNGVLCIGSSPNQKHVVSGSGDGTVCVWKQKDTVWKGHTLQGHTNLVLCVTINLEGSRVVSGSSDGTVHVWMWKDEVWKHYKRQGHDRGVWCVSVSPDGTQAVSGSADKTVRVRKWENGEWKSHSPLSHTKEVCCVMVNSDGTQVVSGTIDGTVRLWKWKDGEWESHELQGHLWSVECVLISSDESQVVSGSTDGTVHVWKWEDEGWESHKQNGHSALVSCVEINEDGSQIVYGSEDGTVCVWKWREGAWKSHKLKGHSNPVKCVSMSRNGAQITSSSRDKTIVWKFENEKWIRTISLSNPDKFVTSNAGDYCDFNTASTDETSVQHTLDEIFQAIGGLSTYGAHRSFFYRILRNPYLVRIDEFP